MPNDIRKLLPSPELGRRYDVGERRSDWLWASNLGILDGSFRAAKSMNFSEDDLVSLLWHFQR